MHMFTFFGIHILTLGMCQYIFCPATTYTYHIYIFMIHIFFYYNPNEKSRQTQRFIANAVLNAFDKSVNWRCTATPFQDQRHNSNYNSTPKETVSMGHSKSILMHIYTENANAFHSWHTHSNSRHVTVHVFPAMTWNACMYHTHTCKKQTNSKIYSKRTSECTWVIRKFEMHCHSFQWSASKLYDIWTWSWNYNSKRNRLNGHSKSILMHIYNEKCTCSPSLAYTF